MSEQILAKLDAIQTTIASLRAEVGGLQAQVLTKADGTAVSALSSTVSGQGRTIASQGGMITAQGKAITCLTSRIDLPCGCNKAAATAETALDTTRVQTRRDQIIVDGQVYINEAVLESAFLRTEVSARAEADVLLASTIRQIIRDELKPGGMLHRV